MSVTDFTLSYERNVHSEEVFITLKLHVRTEAKMKKKDSNFVYQKCSQFSIQRVLCTGSGDKSLSFRRCIVLHKA